MAPARGGALRPSKVFPFEIARWSSGYPSGGPIEAGKAGNVCPIVNIARRLVEPASLVPGPSFGTSNLAESRFHRSRRIVETNREKVAAPASLSADWGRFLELTGTTTMDVAVRPKPPTTRRR